MNSSISSEIFPPIFPPADGKSRDSPQFQEAARWPRAGMAPARGVGGPGGGRGPPAPRSLRPREAPGGAAGGTAGAGTGGWNAADFRDGSAKIWYQIMISIMIEMAINGYKWLEVITCSQLKGYKILQYTTIIYLINTSNPVFFLAVLKCTEPFLAPVPTGTGSSEG